MAGEISNAQSSIEAAKQAVAQRQQQVYSIPPTTYAQALRQSQGVSGMLRRQNQASQIEQAKEQLSSQAGQIQSYEQQLQDYLKTPSGIVQYAREKGIAPEVKTEQQIYSTTKPSTYQELISKTGKQVETPYTVQTYTYNSPYGSTSFSGSDLGNALGESAQSNYVNEILSKVKSVSIPSSTNLVTPEGFRQPSGTYLVNGQLMSIDTSKMNPPKSSIYFEPKSSMTSKNITFGSGSFGGGGSSINIPNSQIDFSKMKGFPTSIGTIQTTGPSGFVMPTLPDTSYARSLLSSQAYLNAVPATFNLPYQTRGTQYIQSGESIDLKTFQSYKPADIKFISPSKPLIEDSGYKAPSFFNIATNYISPLSQTYLPITKALIEEGKTSVIPGYNLPLKPLSPGFQFRVADVGAKLNAYGEKYQSIANLRNELADKINSLNYQLNQVVSKQENLNKDYKANKIEFTDYKNRFDETTKEYNNLDSDVKKYQGDIKKLEFQKEYKAITELGDVTTLSKEMEGKTISLPFLTPSGIKSIEVPGAPIAKAFAAGTEAISFFTPVRYAIAPLAIGRGLEEVGKGNIVSGVSQIGLGSLSLATPLISGIQKEFPATIQFFNSPEVRFLSKAGQYTVPPAIGTLTGVKEFQSSGSLTSALGVGLGTTAGLLGGSFAEQADLKSKAQEEQAFRKTTIERTAETKSFTISPKTKNQIIQFASEEGDVTVIGNKLTRTATHGVRVNYKDPFTGQKIERQFAYVETGKVIGGDGRLDFVGYEIKDGNIAQRIGKIQASSLLNVDKQLAGASTDAVITYNEPKGLIDIILNKKGKEVSYSVKADEYIKPGRDSVTLPNPTGDPIEVKIVKGNTVAKFKIPAQSTTSFDVGRAKITSVEPIDSKDIAKNLFPKGEQFSPERFAKNMKVGGIYQVTEGTVVSTPRLIVKNLDTGKIKVISEEIGTSLGKGEYVPGVIQYTKERGGPIKGFGETKTPPPSSGGEPTMIDYIKGQPTETSGTVYISKAGEVKEIPLGNAPADAKGFANYKANQGGVTIEYIKSEFPNQGVGTRLVQALQNEYPTQTINAISTSDASGFYGKTGFTLVNERIVPASAIKGGVIDTWQLQPRNQLSVIIPKMTGVNPIGTLNALSKEAVKLTVPSEAALEIIPVPGRIINPSGIVILPRDITSITPSSFEIERTIFRDLTNGKSVTDTATALGLAGDNRFRNVTLPNDFVSPLPKEDVLQVPIQQPIQIQEPIQRSTQITTQISRIRVSPSQTNLIPPPTPPGFGFPGLPKTVPDEIIKRRKQKQLTTGFEVQVRRRGRFISTSGYSYSKKEAIAIGVREVTTGRFPAQASFRIIPSAKPLKVTGAEVSSNVLSRFRPPKRPSVGEVFVQRKTTRISSPIEIKAIAGAGAAARRAGVKKTKSPKSFGFNFKRLLKGGYR